MGSGAADLMFRCVFDGSLSMCDMDIDRRPYHRNCRCALHKGKCSNAGSQHKNNISFPKRDFKDKCSLSVSASVVSSEPYNVHSSLARSRDCVNECSGRLYLQQK